MTQVTLTSTNGMQLKAIPRTDQPATDNSTAAPDAAMSTQSA